MSKMNSLCLAVFLCTAVVYGGHVCTDKSQCQPGECCQIMSEFMVVSKRELVTATPIRPIDPIKPIKTGTCEPYKLEGQHCNSFDAMNGYCSCEPGTRCVTEQIPIPTAQLAVSKRSMLPPKPGYQWISTCKKN